jgi:hypothetical protein
VRTDLSRRKRGGSREREMVEFECVLAPLGPICEGRCGSRCGEFWVVGTGKGRVRPRGHNPTGLFRIHRDLIPCVRFLIGEPPEKSSPPSAPLSRAVTHLPDLTSAIIKRLLSYYSNTADFVVLMAQTSVQRRQALEECLDTTVHPTWPSEILFSWDFLVC